MVGVPEGCRFAAAGPKYNVRQAREGLHPPRYTGLATTKPDVEIRELKRAVPHIIVRQHQIKQELRTLFSICQHLLDFPLYTAYL